MSPAGPADGWVICQLVELLLLWIFDHSVHNDARNTHAAWMQAAGFHNLAHLCENPATTVVRGERHSVDVHVDRFFFGTDIASCVGIGAADDRHVYFERPVAENLLTIDLHQFNQFFATTLVASSPVLPRVDKCSKP